MTPIGSKWIEKRQEIWELVLHEGWLQVDVAEFYGISREYARLIIGQLGIPYSAKKVVELWCPWTPPYHPCAGGCGREVYKAGQGHGLCVPCYQHKRYTENDAYRAHHRELNQRWQKENPRNKADIDKRAKKAWQARHRAAGLCIQCSQPAVTKRHCEKHRQQVNARLRKRYARKKAERQVA